MSVQGVAFGATYADGAVEALFEGGELGREGLAFRLVGSRVLLEGPGGLTVLRVDLEQFKSVVVEDLHVRFAELRGRAEYAAQSSRRVPVETHEGVLSG